MLWLSLLRPGTASASKAVTAHLAAKWPETPLLLEARWVRPDPLPSQRGGRAVGWGRAGTLAAPRSRPCTLPQVPSCSTLGASPPPGCPVRSTLAGPSSRSSYFASPADFKLRDFCLIRLGFISIYEGKKVGEDGWWSVAFTAGTSINVGSSFHETVLKHLGGRASFARDSCPRYFFFPSLLHWNEFMRYHLLCTNNVVAIALVGLA